MKLQEPENRNYAATVVRIESIKPLENCDNVVGAPILGSYQAIVGKDTKVGDLGIVFVAETQISEEFARMNNLHRHGNLNNDEGASGYLEDNRRVKAMKFRGHRSDCLFMPLSSLDYIPKFDPTSLNLDDTFDKIGDHDICKKYERVRPQSRLEKNKGKVWVRVDKKFLPEHYDTDLWFKNKDTIPEDKTVIVTQKLHGTSIRIGNTIVARKHNMVEKALKRLGIKIQDHEFAMICGSRKVIKDPNNPNQNHYYSEDIWTKEGMKLTGKVPENYVIYGELVGWTEDGVPTQPRYTYQVPEKTCDLYIYRIAFVNGQGHVTDLTWEQIKEFCRDMDLKHVPELWVGKYRDFQVDDWLDKRFKDEGYSTALPLEGDKALVDEGVCIRVDGLAPYILKAKSPQFLQYETKMADQEAIDLEAEGSVI